MSDEAAHKIADIQKRLRITVAKPAIYVQGSGQVKARTPNIEVKQL